MKNLYRTSALSLAAFCLALGLSAAPAQAKNDNSELVRVAQMRLTDLGYPVGHLDGIMGQATENAIKDFQRNSGLQITGSLTPETFSLLTHANRVGNGTALYQTYETFYRTADYEHLAEYNRVLAIDPASVAWGERWHVVRDQEIPLRFAHLNVREEDSGTLRHYTITLNGQEIMFANNQPGVLRASETFALNNEDAIIFTAYQATGVCPNKSYLLVVHSDGTFDRPSEIGNCAGSYEAHISNNALVISFPGVNLMDGVQTWGTWRYQNSLTVRL